MAQGFSPADLFVWLVRTVPIDHGYAQHAGRRLPPLRLAHTLVKDWPSLCLNPQDFVSLAQGFSPADLFVWLVQTGPIDHGYAQHAGRRIKHKRRPVRSP